MSLLKEVHARWLFLNGRFHPWATLRWENEYFKEVIYDSPQEGVDYKPWVLLPGFVNLHAHLELTALHKQLPQKVPFPQWVGALRSKTQNFQAEQFHASWIQGAQICRDAGTMTVVDVGNSTANWACQVPDGIRVLALKEMIGLDSQISIPRWKDFLRELESYATDKNRIRSFSAHAPFSCAPELLQSVYAYCKRVKIPFFIHISESEQEQELYETASGMYREWIDGIYSHHEFQKPIRSSISYLNSLDISENHCVFVHGNTLTKQELKALKNAEVEVVHCPQSADWFGHPKFGGEMRCIGTDSLASSHSLSQWDQICVVKEQKPSIPIEQLLSAVSEIPGRAISKVFPVGKLDQGFYADWQAIPLPDGFDGSNWEWLLQSKLRNQTLFHFGKNDA